MVQLHCFADVFNTFYFDPFNVLTFLKTDFTIVGKIATLSYNLSNPLIPFHVFQARHLNYSNKSKIKHLLFLLKGKR